MQWFCTLLSTSPNSAEVPQHSEKNAVTGIVHTISKCDSFKYVHVILCVGVNVSGDGHVTLRGGPEKLKAAQLGEAPLHPAKTAHVL